MPGLSLIGAGNRMELKLGDRDAFERFSDDLLEGREVRVVGVVGGRASLYDCCGCNFLWLVTASPWFVLHVTHARIFLPLTSQSLCLKASRTKSSRFSGVAAPGRSRRRTSGRAPDNQKKVETSRA